MTSLDHCGTEDLGLAVRVTYGYVLSTTAILSEAETSFVMIAGLIPQDVRSLFFSFFFVLTFPSFGPSPPRFGYRCQSRTASFSGEQPTKSGHSVRRGWLRSRK